MLHCCSTFTWTHQTQVRLNRTIITLDLKPQFTQKGNGNQNCYYSRRSQLFSHVTGEEKWILRSQDFHKGLEYNARFIPELNRRQRLLYMEKSSRHMRLNNSRWLSVMFRVKLMTIFFFGMNTLKTVILEPVCTDTNNCSQQQSMPIKWSWFK